jgi:hypothetical protein
MDWTPPSPVVAGSLAVGTASYPVPIDALYVATDGSDSNAGTIAAPKRTLSGAIAAAQTGSTIVLRTGEYYESVTVPSTKALTIQAYPGETVWFDGSQRVLSWTGTGPVWTAPYGANWDPIASANYPQVGDGRAHLPEQVWIDDERLTQIADGATPGVGQFSVNRSTDVLSIGTNPAGRDVRVARLRRWMLATGPVVLRGFGVRRYSPAAMEGPDSALVYFAGSSYNSVVENIVFRQSGMHGLAIIRPITLNQITVEDCNSSGIQVTTANNTHISRFIIQGCNTGGWHPQPITAGIKITRTDNIILRDGIVRDIDAAIGVWFDVSNTRFIVANVTISNTEVALESELSGGGFYDGVQNHSWFVNCRTSNSLDWAVKVMDSDYVTVANCDLDAARVSINVQQDHRDNTGTPGNLTFEIVPWVTVHNRLWNNRVVGQPTIAGMIAYHDPPTAARDPDGGPDKVLLGWDFFDEIAGNWFPTVPPGSMIQLGKVDGFRNSYNTWSLANSSPAAVGGPPGNKLGANHQGASTPADTIAVPLPDDIADLLGIPRGHQQVGPILPAPVATDTEEEPDLMTLRQWLMDGTDGVSLTAATTLAVDGTQASQVNNGSATIAYSATTPHAGAACVRFSGGALAQVVRLPFVASAAGAAVSFYHRAASLPAGSTEIFAARHSSGQLFRVLVLATGAVQLNTSTGALIAATAAGVWAINRWNRVEMVWDNSGGASAGTYTLSVYDGDSGTALETLSGSTANLGTALATHIDIGTPNTARVWDQFFDSVQMNDGATVLIGPYLTVVTGTLSASLPRVTASIAGTVTVAGALSAAVPKVTASIAGTVAVTGTLAGSMPRVTASVAGTVTVVGTLNASVPLVTASITGTSTTGDVDRNLPYTLTLDIGTDRTLTLMPTPELDVTVSTPPDLIAEITGPTRTLELEP